MSKNDITVLLVEDELTLAMIIKDTLEDSGFIIHTAADGEEGLRLFFELRPDVLVADVFSAFHGSHEKLVNMAIRKDAIDPHPNARGHEIIAEKMLEKIQEEKT